MYSIFGLSFFKQIAGVVLNGILNYGDIENGVEQMYACDDEKFKKIFIFLLEQNVKHNLFKQFNLNAIFEIRILSVDGNYRGHGIGRNLMIKSEKLAIEKNFKLIKSDATSLFTQKLCTSLGYKTISEMRFDEYKNDNNEIIFNVEPPHVSTKIVIKEINQNQNDNNGI